VEVRDAHHNPRAGDASDAALVGAVLLPVHDAPATTDATGRESWTRAEAAVRTAAGGLASVAVDGHGTTAPALPGAV